MAERKAVSKKTRFEVFKRDGFTCQYCGKSAPTVVLELEHVSPVCKGGGNETMNLLTSCFDCNRGKGKRELTDNQIIKAQQEILKELSEKREQMKMMLKWRKELANIDNEQVDYFCDVFKANKGGYFTDKGRARILSWIKKYGLKNTLAALDTSAEKFAKEDDVNAIRMAFDLIPKILLTNEKEKKDPMLKNKYYINGIMRNRMSYYNNTELYSILNRYLTSEEDFYIFKDIASSATSWTKFIDKVCEIYE